MKKFALAGNPNCGKTTLFNILTGSSAYVGNWPGVTVDKREGTYKKLEEEISIIDLPGIYSLSPYTQEEVVTRDYILNEQPDCIINIVDATNLERNLYLTTQLMEMNVPIIIALNMIDEVRKNNDDLNSRLLEEKIGLPVVEISALHEENIDKLMYRAYITSKTTRQGKAIIENKELLHLINDCKTAFIGMKVKDPLFHAIKLVEMDEIESSNHPDLIEVVKAFKETYSDKTFGTDFEALVADSRYKYITKNYSIAYIRKEKFDDNGLSRSDYIDKVLTNKYLGIPIFLAILFLIFHLTFSENFLYLGKYINSNSFEGTLFEGVLWTENGINSLGVMLSKLVGSFTSWLTDLVSSGLVHAKPWVQGLIVNGVLSGIFAVIEFLPQILTLFLLFSILEDSGYMARVAFILDKIMRKFGLSGRAFMPLIMGFGCSVPAIMNTRSLADENEKVATIRIIPFFCCGAKLPILTVISGAIVSYMGVLNADLITYSMYVLGVSVAMISVLIMRKTSLKGNVALFLMELPTYHFPKAKSLAIHLWDKAKHFIEKAFTIILSSTIIVWALCHFSWSFSYLSDDMMNNSIIASIGKILQPLFTPLGFGAQLSEWGWVFIVAAITGLIAKENVVSTFGVLAACISAITNTGIDIIQSDTSNIISVIEATNITIPALLAFIAYNLLTIPCMAAVASARGELSKKHFIFTILFWLFVSYITSSAIYVIGSYWWTSFIYVILLSSIILLLRNKKYKK